jgi:adenosylcobinamide-GDP ribazoletransferase
MSDESESNDNQRTEPAAPEATSPSENGAATLTDANESPIDASSRIEPANDAKSDEPLLLDSSIEDEPADDESAEDSPDEPLDEHVDEIGGLGLAIAFLTRLPFGRNGVPAPGALARSMGLFPLVGVMVGGIGGAAYAVAHFALPAAAAAILAIGAIALVTGALHEDGLADTADGFGGGVDRARKLEIMRDSRIGTYGMVALALTLALRATALAEIGASLSVVGALVAAHALARAAIPLAMQALTPARPDGLGAAAGQPSPAQTGIAITLAVVIAALVLPPGAALAALAGATIGVTLIVLLAQDQIGGFTGDVLGTVEQAAETLALLGAVAAL